MTNTKYRLVVALALMAGAFSQAIAQAPSFSTSVNQSLMYQHQIQNFDYNTYSPSAPSYMTMLNHALAMSYDATSYYLNGSLPSKYNSLKRIMNHNVATEPLSISFPVNSAPLGKYNFVYANNSGASIIDSSKMAGRDFKIDWPSLSYLAGYGCAKSADYWNISPNSTLNDFKNRYRADWVTSNEIYFVGNLQSRYVVWDLVQKTIASLKTGFYDQMFMDVVIGTQQDCVNKEYGGWGSYSSWKEGQTDYINQITNAARSMYGRLGSRIKVTGNIWSPYADIQSAQWYANSYIRLDHYFFESGGFAIEDTSPTYHYLATNGSDPANGLPAFWNASGGHIPANKMSVAGKYAFLGSPNDTGAIGEAYMMQHYSAAGVGASQGSWFGWYGQAQVDLRNSWGRLVHTNAMMLLRAIPNWENLVGTPVWNRYYNWSTYQYWSPNNQFSKSAIQGWNPINKTLYAVFMDKYGQIDLKGGTIKTAYFADEVFNATSQSALSCLSSLSGAATLTCANKVKQGIRITFQ
ncbi:MAG: hypothetical protein ABL933_16005 [Methyloglobulus sp.]|nr:hypothetical protein [Methyloglobulus sp.]